MTPAEAARDVASNLSCAGLPEMDHIAAAFEHFAYLLDEPEPDTGDDQ